MVLATWLNVFRAFTRDRKRKVLSQEAEYWIQDTNSDWPFSFANICETFGFAPDYFRQGLTQWKAAKLENRAKAKIHQRKRGIAITGRARHRLRRVASRCLPGRLPPSHAE